MDFRYISLLNHFETKTRNLDGLRKTRDKGSETQYSLVLSINTFCILIYNIYNMFQTRKKSDAFRTRYTREVQKSRQLTAQLEQANLRTLMLREEEVDKLDTCNLRCQTNLSKIKIIQLGIEVESLPVKFVHWLIKVQPLHYQYKDLTFAVSRLNVYFVVCDKFTEFLLPSADRTRLSWPRGSFSSLGRSGRTGRRSTQTHSWKWKMEKTTGGCQRHWNWN